MTNYLRRQPKPISYKITLPIPRGPRFFGLGADQRSAASGDENEGTTNGTVSGLE